MASYRGALLSPAVFARTAALIAGAAIIAYFAYHLVSLFSPPFLIVERPERDIITTDGTLALSGRTKKESHVFVNGREIAVSDAGVFSDTVVLQEGMNVIEFRSVNKFGKETMLVRRIVKE